MRTTGVHEQQILRQARATGPFVGWRDAAGELRTHHLRAGELTTIGRAPDCTITFDHVFVSRQHCSMLMSVGSKPTEVGVCLLDLRSRHGTEHRLLEYGRGEAHPSSPLEAVPVEPMSPLRLDEGDHDVKLAGELWILVGGVPRDDGRTRDRKHTVRQPTIREHDVLVELCRPRLQARGRGAAPPSNGEIAVRLTPVIGAARVSDILSKLYRKYELMGTPGQNRVALVELAVTHRLVEPGDVL